jgi:hypothetical protein
LASFDDIGRVQNRRHNTDTPRAGGKDGIDVSQVDATDGEPGNPDVVGGPANVAEGDRSDAGFRIGGVNRPYRDVSGTRRDGALRLSWFMRTEADSKFSRPCFDLSDIRVSGVEEILLPEVA